MRFEDDFRFRTTIELSLYCPSGSHCWWNNESKLCRLRARRALMLFKDVPLRTRRALSLYKVYGDNALLVHNGTSLNSISALLALSRRLLLPVAVETIHAPYPLSHQSDPFQLFSWGKRPCLSLLKAAKNQSKVPNINMKVSVYQVKQ